MNEIKEPGEAPERHPPGTGPDGLTWDSTASSRNGPHRYSRGASVHIDTDVIVHRSTSATAIVWLSNYRGAVPPVPLVSTGATLVGCERAASWPAVLA